MNDPRIREMWDKLMEEEISRSHKEEKQEKLLNVLEAARHIYHWHDWGKENEGMVVSSKSVRELWKARAEYDAVCKGEE